MGVIAPSPSLSFADQGVIVIVVVLSLSLAPRIEFAYIKLCIIEALI